MPLVLIMPRYRKYQQGDIIDENDTEAMTARYAWAVAEVSEADAEPLKQVPHDPKRSQADTNAANDTRQKAVAAIMPKLRPLAETKKPEKSAPVAAKKPTIPKAQAEPAADATAEKGTK